MTITQWLLFIVVVQLIHFAGTWKLYQRAGRQAWEAAVPIYNAVVLMKIINRPWWYTILLFVPIVNLIMFMVVWTETARSFGFNSYKDTALVVLTCGLYLYYINYATDAPHIKERELQPKSKNGEWVSSILFAIVAATIVHTYFMQPFTIPTSSLEKTLLVGDYLFVSKFHYGARTPMTTVAAPMLHDSLIVVKSKSYLPKPQLPYFRLPGFQDIKRNDIVVFSWPVDTLINANPGQEYGSVRKPIDKKSNYVKRCVGLPGDSLSVRNGYVYINGEKNQLPDRARLQFGYTFDSKELFIQTTPRGEIIQKPTPFVSERYDISDIYISNIDRENRIYTYTTQLTEESAALLKANTNVQNLKRIPFETGQRGTRVFPNAPIHDWNVNEYGPIYIPEEGKTVAITPESLPFYKRIIEVYEGYELGYDHKVTVSGTQVYLNGAPLNEYTFKQNYYWMMGDNRNNSLDARAWGYVPETHVMGKPVMVWLSLDPNKEGNIIQRLRWDRMFTTVGGNGPLVSYRYLVLALILLYFGYSFYKSKGKKKA
ncbi:MAG: signal peptidase I [Cytophagaceae bacterium]|nr:signal peptidase I [Cytophagaceae bacterium]